MAINETNQRLEFGGFNWLSAFYGWIVASALAALFTAVLTASGAAVAFTNGVSSLTNNLSGVGLMSALYLVAAMAVSYYAGGYVAGRMSRFDGGRQGLGVWAMGLIVAAILALVGVAFGANYNLLQQLNLPHIPVQDGALSIASLVTLLVGMAVTLAAAFAGAKVGEAYHRRVDQSGVAEMETGAYQPAEYDRPMQQPAEPVYADRTETDTGQEELQRGYTRRDAQPSFGERIERHNRD